MARNNRHINLAFGVVLALLAAVAVSSMYLNKDQPAIRDAPPAVETGGGGKLPEGHPPIDSGNKLAALENLSRSDPQNPEYKIQLGNGYYDGGQYQKAVGAYEEALKLRPRDAAVETDLATCYHYLGQPDKALEIFDRVLQYQPGFPQALFNKGVVLVEAKKDARQGIAAWEELLRANPNYPQRAAVEQRIRQLQSQPR